MSILQFAESLYKAYLKPKNGYFIVSELKTTEENGLKCTYDFNTAIVSPTLLKKIKPSHVDPVVHKTGVNFDKDFTYTPSFWLYLSKSLGLKKVEPLVVSWCDGNHTTFQIDQGFLATFKLTPRLTDKEIIWDDLTEPEKEVVRNKPLSKYKHSSNSEAYVKVKKEYLERYFYLRKKRAVQVFNIKKEIYRDNEVGTLLNGKKYYQTALQQCEITIKTYLDKKDIALLEINGFQELPLDYSFSKGDVQEPIGHYWKGIEGLVSCWRAQHEMPFEYVYVNDKVLQKYENDEDHQVYPQSGSVAYGNQWSVGQCERVGRNAIKLEVKKLYEGNRLDTIDYWNQFSIHPDDIIEGENIAAKAERLTRKYFLFSRLFSSLMNRHFDSQLTAMDIISLNEEQINYRGWTDFPQYEPITHVVDLEAFSKSDFTSRCTSLVMLLVESMKQKELKKIVDSLGFRKEDTKDFRSLKLLELILKYFCVAADTGLSPNTDRATIVERAKEIEEFTLLSPLFALNDIRQVGVHQTREAKTKLQNALVWFSIHPNEISGNYADACFQIYDVLIDMFSKVNSLLSSFYELE